MHKTVSFAFLREPECCHRHIDSLPKINDIIEAMLF